MKETIGVCLIGTGRAGMIHGKNFVSRVPHAKMVAVVDTIEESAKKSARELGVKTYYTDYKKAFENDEIDAVVVVTPTKFHRDIVITAANAKKHILCEKPMAMNPEECEEMIAAAKRNQVKLQIGFMRRFDRGFRRAKEMIDSGEIGDVVLVKSLTHGPSVPREWMYDISKSNGPLAEVNSHDIDTMRWLTGSEAISLHAIAGNYRCLDAKEKYSDFYDTVIMNVCMENGTMGNIDGAQGVQYGYDARVDILGTKGMIQIGGLRDKTTVLYTKEKGMASDVVKSWMDLFSEAYIEEDISFVECIRMDREPCATGIDGQRVAEIVRAGNRSIQTGNVVEL